MGGMGMAKMIFGVMAKVPIGAAFLALVAAGCAHQSAKLPVELPDAAEIGGYVAAHWRSDFDQRFSRFAPRQGQPSELVSVRNAHCDLNWGGSVAECAYDVTADFKDGARVTKQLSSQFERGRDGALNEAIIIWHERRR